ncbi:MAG: ribose-phosphate diphosphokinase, partial [Solirubrobacteraceae bacterium]
AMSMLTQYVRDLNREDLVVVSPDVGRVKLAKKFAEKVGAELAILNKERPAHQVAEIAYVIGDVKGRNAVIVDDMIDTAGTLRAAAETVMDEGAKSVIAVTPWFGYSRQDKKSTPREPISARLVARMLEAAGADRVLTMDLHAGQLQGFFQKPVDHMTAMFILTQYFKDLHLDDLVVVSPDAGRVKLAKKFAEKVGAELAILNKERPAQQVAEIAYVIGDVKDKTAVIVDDLIDTAGTLRAAAETVIDEGAKRVFACATHGVFSGSAWENLASSPFEEVVVTDTIPMRPGAPENVRVLSCADLLTDSIRRIFTDDSVSEVFGGENQLF